MAGVCTIWRPGSSPICPEKYMMFTTSGSWDSIEASKANSINEDGLIKRIIEQTKRVLKEIFIRGGPK